MCLTLKALRGSIPTLSATFKLLNMKGRSGKLGPKQAHYQQKCQQTGA